MNLESLYQEIILDHYKNPRCDGLLVEPLGSAHHVNPTCGDELTVDDVAGLEQAADELAAERLADLQRVTAEYANYRNRTEANRELDRERAIADTVRLLLPVLDDVDRAEKHGDLVEGAPLTAIAVKLRGVAERLGLTAYAQAGELFDPNIHEAIVQQPSDDVTVETILDVAERGYLLGATQVRAAKVVVSVPNG